jgi:hypothetical protein
MFHNYAKKIRFLITKCMRTQTGGCLMNTILFFIEWRHMFVLTLTLTYVLS